MIIWGFRSYVRVLAMLSLVCQRCGNPAAHRVLKHTRKFTLFFIPLFPISVKYSMTCTFCGQGTRLSKEQAEQMIAGATGQPAPVQQQPPAAQLPPQATMPQQPPSPYQPPQP
ncbi:MAG TPA: zinc-ribbon domain-containing protein [Jatrophihabitans sp.]|nr:zinc-ribbon domain-containing protein [Jatrophihabitans sp.]